jgi:signal transduction histidine kinase
VFKETGKTTDVYDEFVFKHSDRAKDVSLSTMRWHRHPLGWQNGLLASALPRSSEDSAVPQMQRLFERKNHIHSKLGQLLSAAILGFLLLTTQSNGQGQMVLTNLTQVRALPLAAGTNQIMFKLQGVVTYCDPEWKVLFVQDGPSGAFVSHTTSEEDPEYKLLQGQVVEMEGSITPGLAHCNLVDEHSRVLGEAPMPTALELSGPAAFNDSAEGRWVRITGWVVGPSALGNRVTLSVLVHPGRTVTLVLRGMDSATAETLQGALIEITGVLALKVNRSGQKTGEYLLFNRNLDTLRRLKELPILSLVNILKRFPSLPAQEPVRVNGMLTKRLSDGALMLRDGLTSESLRLECEAPPGMRNEMSFEAFGFPSQQPGGPVLTNAFLKPITREHSSKVLSPLKANTKLREINKVIGVRSLSSQEAANGYPVRIVGVVTFFDPGSFAQFIQDDTAGIYIDVTKLEDGMLELGAGRKVEVTGFTGPGEYAPVIHAQHLRVLEAQSSFPTTPFTTVQTLMTGTEDSQWVSLRGVVRHQSMGTNHATTLVLATGDAPIRVNIPEAADRHAVGSLEDASVVVHGVCRTIFNERRHLESVELDVPNWERVQVTESPPPNPFDLPVRPITELFQFHTGHSGLHRVHLQGRVLLCQKDGTFYLQDETGGIRVQPFASAFRSNGESVEAAGFPALVEGLPILQDSLVRVVNKAQPVAPNQLTPDSALDDTLHATLVQLEGRIIGHSTRGHDELITVEFGSQIIDAIFNKASAGGSLPKIAPGSIVRLTGVYAARPDDDHRMQSFQLLLRTAEDVRIISQPSWWSVRHTAWVLCGLGGVLLLSMAWIRLLRVQVQQRTGELRDEIEERKRMEAKIEKSHKDLLEASHRAGMAEVATSVLHNVGNVLNSVNVSSSVVATKVRTSRVGNVAKAVALIRAHEADLHSFLIHDPKGRQLVGYLESLAQHLTEEQQQMLHELDKLGSNIEHIKEIVSMQQNYAKVCGLTELLPVTELVLDAIRFNAVSLQQQQIEIVREFSDVPPVLLDKHKALQILVNLVSNAKHACVESGRDDKRLTVRVTKTEEHVRISIIDNGVGIAPENLTRIFNYGFTTRKEGHGFGLHSGALAAKELGGSLRLHSEGLGKGTTATLELPCRLLFQNDEKLDWRGISASKSAGFDSTPPVSSLNLL